MNTSTEIKTWQERAGTFEDLTVTDLGCHCGEHVDAEISDLRAENQRLAAALESAHQALRQITYEGPSTAVRIATQALAGVKLADSGRDATEKELAKRTKQNLEQRGCGWVTRDEFMRWAEANEKDEDTPGAIKSCRLCGARISNLHMVDHMRILHGEKEGA